MATTGLPEENDFWTGLYREPHNLALREEFAAWIEEKGLAKEAANLRKPFDPKKLKLWRCANPACSNDKAGRAWFDFWAVQPICPKCEVDKLKEPRLGNLIVPLTIIHFAERESKVKGLGTGLRVCDRRHVSYMNGVASGVPAPVNCPECRKTTAWKTAAEEFGEPVPLEDVELEFDPKTGILQKV